MKQTFLNPAQLALLNLRADAEQSAVDTAFADLVAKAGKVDGLEKDLATEKLKVTGLESQINTANEKAVTDLLAQAVKETKCTQEFANLIATSHKGRVEEVKAIIATMKPYTPIVSQLSATGTALPDGKTWDELDRSGKLEDLKAKNPEQFKALFKERFGAEYTGA